MHTRLLVAVLALASLLVGRPVAADRGQAQGAPALVEAVDSVDMTVGDADRSAEFLSRVLGFAKVSELEVAEDGVEQERLNNVFGAGLRITTLRAAAGPGIELLEYLAPRDGRPTPEEWRANDLSHWETTLRASDLEEGERRLRKSRTGFVSPGIVEVPSSGLGFSRALVVRDPDRHTLRLAEP